jgi:hypothetical protein
MVKKFNLSVPDELAEKIEERRAELGNLSSIFQEAVGKIITQKEEFEARLKGDDDMEAIVARLKKEKLEITREYYDRGLEDGLAWAKAASYQDLMNVINTDFVAPNGVDFYVHYILVNDSIGDMFREVFRDPVMDMDHILDEYRHPHRVDPEEYCLYGPSQQYFNGWIEAVHAFWDKVAEQVAD